MLNDQQEQERLLEEVEASVGVEGKTISHTTKRGPRLYCDRIYTMEIFFTDGTRFTIEADCDEYAVPLSYSLR